MASTRKGVAVDPAEDAEEDTEDTDVDDVGDELARLEALLLCADVGDELAMLKALGVEPDEDGVGDELASWLIDVAWLVDCVP